MKRVIATAMFLVLLMTLPLLVSSCASLVPNYDPDDTFRFRYFHDETHEVGLWWDSRSGGIAILPDTDYINVGKPIEEE